MVHQLRPATAAWSPFPVCTVWGLPVHSSCCCDDLTTVRAEHRAWHSRCSVNKSLLLEGKLHFLLSSSVLSFLPSPPKSNRLRAWRTPGGTLFSGSVVSWGTGDSHRTLPLWHVTLSSPSLSCCQQPQQARPANVQRAHHQACGLQPGATRRPQPPARAKHTPPLPRGADRAAQGQVSWPPPGAGEVPRPHAQHAEGAVPWEAV